MTLKKPGTVFMKQTIESGSGTIVSLVRAFSIGPIYYIITGTDLFSNL